MLIVLLLCSCGSRGSLDTWAVLVPSIPSSIVLEREGETAVSYILRQTHEPLFRKTDGQNFTSRLLTVWSRSIDYSEYRFCADTSLRFNEKQDFSSDYFYSYIKKVTGSYATTFELGADGKCVTVKFPSPKTGYLDFLSRYNRSPSLAVGDGVAIGLGPFMVESLSGDRAVLSRKKRVRTH